MRKALYGLFVVLGLALGFTFGSLNAAAQGLNGNEIKSLQGYKSYGMLSSFTRHLRQDPVLYKALSSNPQLSEKVLGSTTLQRKLLSDINKSGDSQSVVSSYVNEFSQTGNVTGNTFGDSFARQEEQRQKRRELNQQQLSGDEDGASKGSQRLGNTNGNANLAAQRAIEQAQRDREAAERRAKEMIAQAQAQLDTRNEQGKFQAEMLRFKAVQDMISQIAHDTAALDAFWADTQMLQKLMDNEMTIEDAMAELGVTPPPVTPGTTAPAPEPTPHTTPDPADDTISDDDDGLVHISGNKYQIDGRNVYDLNHIPTEDEMALDANGWPKFLNVPAECGPKNDDVTYFFEHRFGRGKTNENGYIASLKRGAAMDLLNEYGLFFQGELGTAGLGLDTGLTDDEVYAAPFTVPNLSLLQFHSVGSIKFDLYPGLFVPDLHGGVGKGFFAVSISHCPDDWQGITPGTKVKLGEACRLTYDDLIREHANNYRIKIKEKNAPDVFESMFDDLICVLEPGKRYFLNIAPTHKVDPDADSITGRMLKIYERLTSRNPEDYPLTPEQHLQAYLNNSEAPIRRGKMIGSAGSYNYGAGSTLASFFPLLPRIKQANWNRLPLKLTADESFYLPLMSAQGRVVEVGDLCQSSGKGQKVYDKTCYDPYNKLPPQRVVLECLNNTQAVWAEGYNANLFSDYICENTIATPTQTTRRIGRMCTSRNEGTFRRVEYKNPHLSRNPSTSTVEQCQFDKARGRFDWIAVEARPSSKNLGGHQNHNQVVYSQTADIPARRNCVIGDKVVQLGDSVTLACENFNGSNISDSSFSYELSCQQVADEPALPALVNENGYNINRMVTDLKTAKKVRSLLSWLPQCKVK